ncbi:met-10+ like family protein / kelch repeat-containing protein isoform X1 [Wolffia australiana]
MEFEKRKAMAMEAMKDPEPDKSPKGTLDLPIVPLLQFINGNPSFFTTSSCSGRISIFSHAPSPQIDSTVAFDDVSTVEFKKKSKKKKAGGGRWILVSHGLVEAESVVNLLFGSGSGKGSAGEGDLVFRFEPFILAVECRDATSAQFLVSTAIASGFRESGITSLGRRIIIAIRCSIRLEVPLGSNGEIMVSPEYIRYLVEIANDKMRENKKKTDAFYRALSCQTIVSSVETSNTSLGRSNNISGEPKAIKPSADKDFQLPMSVERITIKGEPLEKLFLWGQSACALKGNHRDEIIVFGGFGGIGRHARRNEALMMDPSSGFLRLIRAEGHPSPRLGHTLSAVGKWVFVIGGRGDPTQIFNDVWAFDMEESRWMLMSCSGNILPGRHRHAAAVVGSDIYVFGGLNAEMIFSSLHVLDTNSMEWREVEIHGENPCARHSHSLVANDSLLFMFGGYDGQKALGDFHVFNVAKSCWTRMNASGKAPSPRFSHSMFIYGDFIGIIGGCPLRHHHEVYFLNIEHCIWRCVSVSYVDRGLWVRSSAIVLGDDLILLGGGASCYAFGTKFNTPVRINLRSLLSCGKFEIESIIKLGGNPCTSPDSFSIFWNSLSRSNEKNSSVNQDEKCLQFESLVLSVQKRYAKHTKDILKQFGWLDLSRKVNPSKDGVHILLPISFKFVENASKIAENLGNGPELLMSSGYPLDDLSIPRAMEFLLVHGTLITSDRNSCAKRTDNNVQKNLTKAVSSLLSSKGLPSELIVEVPKRWDRLGDMVVIPVNSFKDSAWESISEELWPIVARSLGAHRLARQGRVLPTGTRDSSLEILVGDNGLVEHTENGIIYSFDATKCMFSLGNLSEKLRMAKLDCRDEVVVDLFAGIGYFVLQFLVRAKARLVYACEWNPHALAALRRILEINMVADRCIVIEGDNRLSAPKGVADRVCLGLIPSSECSWLTAVRALRPEGGVLHIHGNVNDSEETVWAEFVVKSVDRMAKEEGYSWDVSLQHLEHVKSYAPHVHHLVADVRCHRP